MKKMDVWLIEVMDEIVRMANAPRTHDEATRDQCPYTTGFCLCVGLKCSSFVSAQMPEKFNDGFPVATSVEKSRMTNAERKEIEESERWAMNSLFVCSRTKAFGRAKP